MRTYVESNLLKNEKILFTSRRHWVVFIPAILWLIAAIYFYFQFPALRNLALFPLILGILQGSFAAIDYFISEIAVTNMRVIIKVGLIARSSYETLIRNVSSIDVIQSFWGRILHYGSIVVYDTGFQSVPFSYISAPFAFRRAVQTQIEHQVSKVEVVEKKTLKTEK